MFKSFDVFKRIEVLRTIDFDTPPKDWGLGDIFDYAIDWLEQGEEIESKDLRIGDIIVNPNSYDEKLERVLVEYIDRHTDRPEGTWQNEPKYYAYRFYNLDAAHECWINTYEIKTYIHIGHTDFFRIPDIFHFLNEKTKSKKLD